MNMNRYIAEGIARDLEAGKHVAYVNLIATHRDLVHWVAGALEGMGVAFDMRVDMIRLDSGGVLTCHSTNPRGLDGMRFDVAVVSRSASIDNRLHRIPRRAGAKFTSSEIIYV